MPQQLKKGTKILVVEGAQQGQIGLVTQCKREYDADARATHWMIWADDINGGERIKVRLACVREI